MQFSLSTAVITDTIHALAALEALSATDGETRLLLAPLLDRERPGPLRLMVKNAFAEIILRLLPYVGDVELDGESPDSLPGHQSATDGSDILLKVSLKIPAGAAPSLSSAVRRNLELAVVYRTLASALLATRSSVAGSLISSFSARSAEAVAAVLSVLRSPSRPFVRSRSY